MKKRCEVALVILKLSIHEFISLFSRKRVDELKNKLRAIKYRSKMLLIQEGKALGAHCVQTLLSL